MPWRKVPGEESRYPAEYWRAMAVSFEKIHRPQNHHGEDLVLAVSMGGLAERVVCGTSVMPQAVLMGKDKELPIMICS